MNPSTYPGPVTQVDTSPLTSLGAFRVEYDRTNGGVKTYRYLLYASTADSSAANGTVVTFTDVYGTSVTNTIAEGLGANNVAGVAVGTVAAGKYAWFQTGGYHSAVATNGDDDISSGDTLIASGNGTVDSVAAGTASTYKPLGFAVADDINAADTVAARITIDMGA